MSNKTLLDQIKISIKSIWIGGEISSETYEYLMERINNLANEENQETMEIIVNKQLDALEYHIPRFMRWSDEGANIEVTNSEFQAYKEIAKNYIEEEVLKLNTND